MRRIRMKMRRIRMMMMLWMRRMRLRMRKRLMMRMTEAKDGYEDETMNDEALDEDEEDDKDEEAEDEEPNSTASSWDGSTVSARVGSSRNVFFLPHCSSFPTDKVCTYKPMSCFSFV